MRKRPLDDDEYRSYELKGDDTKVSARSLMKGAGLTDEQIRRPFIGVCNSYSNFFPGHSDLDKIGQAVKDGVLMGGGTPVEFGTIGICDGMVMGTDGMKYSLPSRELIADSVETMAKAHICDALVLVCGCDKIIPGMIMGALRLDLPFIVVTAGRLRGRGLPHLRLLPGHVHRQFDGVHDRGARLLPARDRHRPRRQREAVSHGQAQRHAGGGAREIRFQAVRFPHAGILL